jgi:hypothetical protein
MTNGVDIRAQIDTEVVRGLLLINGGGAVALLALLTNVLGTADYSPLARAILWALLSFMLGLATAIVHNRLRRVCSNVYDIAWHKSPPTEPAPCRAFGFTFSEPCVCMRSIFFMWLSLGFFFLGGFTVFLGGLYTIGCGRKTMTFAELLLEIRRQVTPLKQVA